MAGTNGRKPKTRIYWRSRGNSRRAYGDFRDFADVGGGREALTRRIGREIRRAREVGPSPR